MLSVRDKNKNVYYACGKIRAEGENSLFKNARPSRIKVMAHGR